LPKNSGKIKILSAYNLLCRKFAAVCGKIASSCFRHNLSNSRRSWWSR